MVEIKVSIIIPAYNEEETIGDVLKDTIKTTRKLPKYSFEIIVVDNNSNDRTAAIAKKQGVKVLTEKKKGKGNALIRGFKESKCPIIIMLDADGSHLPSDIPKFLKKIEEGYGLVIGSRIRGGSDEYTPTRALGNVFLTVMTNFFFQVKLTDALNGYKAMRHEIVNKCSSKEFEIEIEILSNCLIKGYKVSEIPSHELARKGGKMKSVALIHGTRFLMNIFIEGIKYKLHKLKN